MTRRTKVGLLTFTCFAENLGENASLFTRYAHATAEALKLPPKQLFMHHAVAFGINSLHASLR